VYIGPTLITSTEPAHRAAREPVSWASISQAAALSRRGRRSLSTSA
jgi:hypothetical protein